RILSGGASIPEDQTRFPLSPHQSVREVLLIRLSCENSVSRYLLYISRKPLEKIDKVLMKTHTPAA
ncbi:MAG: hypothetical protein KAJ37_05450, partial [Candidatus Krumholzibacteria bacterium]|nr:hypothetical protein [Candidatus Krumholzibacteria bacterium]